MWEEILEGEVNDTISIYQLKNFLGEVMNYKSSCFKIGIKLRRLSENREGLLKSKKEEKKKLKEE